MQGKKVPVLRIDPVGREAASQSVGAVVHGFHAFDDRFAGHKLTFSGDHGGDRTAGRDPNLSFDFVHISTPPKEEKERGLFAEKAYLLRRTSSFFV